MKKILVKVGTILLWLSSSPVALADQASFVKKFNSKDIRVYNNFVEIVNYKILEKFEKECIREGGKKVSGRVEATTRYCRWE